MIHDVFAYLHVDGAARAIEFYATVFGATEKLRLTDLDGRIQPRRARFRRHHVMLADEFPEYGVRGPLTLGGPSATIYLRSTTPTP